MASFDHSVDVDVHISEAFMLFSDFERFPDFMEGVEEVRRTGDDTLRWRAEIVGIEEEWDAKVTTLSPNERIAWKSVSGAKNEGDVTFEKLNERQTRVHLRIEYEPEGFVENVGTALGFVNARMRGDLERFKRAVEDGAAVSNGWNDAASGKPLDPNQADIDSNKPLG